MSEWKEFKRGQKMPNGLGEISKLVIKTLGRLKLTNRRRAKTTLIMESLTLLGDRKQKSKPHFRVYSHGLSKKFLKRHKNKHFRNVEWLYDLHWYNENEGSRYQITSLPLVLECEWDWKRKNDETEDDYGAVKYDFQKLLVANADLKVMIFKKRIKNAENKNAELDRYFVETINGYRHLSRDSKFLFIALDNNGFFYAISKITDIGERRSK
jgi:hypothetical protein